MKLINEESLKPIITFCMGELHNFGTEKPKIAI